MVTRTPKCLMAGAQDTGKPEGLVRPILRGGLVWRLQHGLDAIFADVLSESI